MAAPCGRTEARLLEAAIEALNNLLATYVTFASTVIFVAQDAVH